MSRRSERRSRHRIIRIPGVVLVDVGRSEGVGAIVIASGHSPAMHRRIAREWRGRGSVEIRAGEEIVYVDRTVLPEWLFRMMGWAVAAAVAAAAVAAHFML